MQTTNISTDLDKSLCEGGDVRPASSRSIFKAIRKKNLAKFARQLRHNSAEEKPQTSRRLFSDYFSFHKRLNYTPLRKFSSKLDLSIGQNERLRRSFERKNEEINSFFTPRCQRTPSPLPQTNYLRTDSTNDLFKEDEQRKLFLMPPTSAKPIPKSGTRE